MRARVATTMALAVAASALAGCIDLQVFPAEIPAGSLAPGWGPDSGNTQSGTVGQEPIVRASYHVNAYRDGGSTSLTSPQGSGMAMVVSIPDAPIVDEQAEVQKRIDQLVADNGVQLTPRAGASGTIAGAAVEAKLYDATVPFGTTRAKGLAVDVAFKCPANGQHVRAFGYAVIEVTTLGRSFSDRVTWGELAGDADRTAALGGMLTAIRCS